MGTHLQKHGDCMLDYVFRVRERSRCNYSGWSLRDQRQEGYPDMLEGLDYSYVLRDYISCLLVPLSSSGLVRRALSSRFIWSFGFHSFYCHMGSPFDDCW